MKGAVKETTYASYAYVSRNHLSPAIGHVKLKSLTPVRVRGFYGDKARCGLSAATVKKMHVVLRKALDQAVSDGLVPRNAADGVKTPRVGPPGEDIKPLDPGECAAFLEAARGERLEALYVLALHCGLREGELLALRWEDVDLEADEKPALLVRRTLTRGEDGRGWTVGASTKSGKGRRVRLSRRAAAALKEHRKRQLEERMRLSGLWQDLGLVFPAATGSLFNPSNLRNRSFVRIKQNILGAALDYRHRGLIVTPLSGKRPVLRRWHERQLNEKELPRYFNEERNVGLVLGGPAGVVDVDLDNPVAVAAADLLLPDTVKSGRERSLRLHRWYLCRPAAPAPRKYALPKIMAERLKVETGEDVLVELRGLGQQTMIPPSVHPVDGDRCLWHPGEIREIDGDELANLVLDVAVAALLALNRPLATRTWFAVRAAVYLTPRLGLERTERIVAAASAGFEDEEHDDRMRAVRSVLRQSVGVAPTTDAAMAAELERLAPGVPALIARWCARGRRDKGGSR